VRAFNTLGWENFTEPPTGPRCSSLPIPVRLEPPPARPPHRPARPAAEELITAVGLEPDFTGNAGASARVDALLPLWFAMIRHNGGNQRVALPITR
jgi:hypothetical protein